MPDKCLTSVILTSNFIMKLSLLIFYLKKASVQRGCQLITWTNIRCRLGFAFKDLKSIAIPCFLEIISKEISYNLLVDF